MKWGHGVLLGEVLDKKLQMYLKKVINNGGLLTAAVAIDAARGLLLTKNQNKLAEFGGHIDLNRHCSYSQYKRMGFVQKNQQLPKESILLKLLLLKNFLLYTLLKKENL